MLKLMKENGIARVNPEASETFSANISENTEKLIRKLKQNIQINAKKTLEKQNILDILEKENIIENYDY